MGLYALVCLLPVLLVFIASISDDAMAMLFMVLGPILIAYPFFQKYFVKGLTVGAVKG